MKIFRILYLSLLQVGVGAGLYAQLPQTPAEPPADKDSYLSSLAEDAGVDPDWFKSAIAQIEHSEYFFRFEEKAGQWKSANREQNLYFSLEADGYKVMPRAKETQTWEASFRLQGIGREEVRYFCPQTNPQICKSENLLEASHDNFVVQYHNTEAGMRQNFIVNTRPSGSGDLRVELQIESQLKPILKGSSAIVLAEQNPGNGTWDNKLWYKDLQVWDANGAPLEAHMELNGNLLALVVEDDAAAYPVTIDPLNANANWIYDSNNPQSWFGYGLSSAGSVNRDQFSDVIIAAYNWSGTFNNQGRVFLFLGSATGLDAAPVWEFSPNQNDAFAGRSVSTAGNVNGDPFSDVIIGCEFCGPNLEGQAFVFHGNGMSLAGAPVADESDADWEATGPSANSRFGYSVGLAGDIDNDGHSDILVGAPQYANGELSEGAAYLWLGSGSGLTPGTSGITGAGSNYTWRAESNEPNALFGCSVYSAGDMNDDGRSDIIVGAWSWKSSLFTQFEGAVFFWSGDNLSGNVASSTANWSARGGQQYNYFGEQATCAGDLNGDGFSDIVVGARGWDPTASGSNGLFDGAAYVWYGNATDFPTGTTVNPMVNAATADWIVTSSQSNALFGVDVNCAGDVNGDGYSDIIIGAPYMDRAGLGNQGEVYVFLGSANGLTPATGATENDADWSFSSNQLNAEMGWAVASAGDVNLDGFSDVLFSAIKFDDGQVDEGRAYCVHGCAEGLSNTPTWERESNVAFTIYAFDVSSAGDVNGDGFNDVIIGSPFFDNGALADAGQVTVWHGSTTGLSTVGPNWTFNGPVANEWTGFSVSCAGDVNADGFSDIIIGVPLHDEPLMADAGEALIFRGSATGLAAAPNWTVSGERAGDRFGYSVSGAGDIQGDGYTDVIVGAPLADDPGIISQQDEGRAYVFFSNQCIQPNTIADWTVESNQGGARLGECVAAAGKINGGGFGNVIIGAPFYDNGQNDEGIALVYYGDATGLGANGTPFNADFLLESNNANARLGFAVASAGDTDADGFDEIIVGAPQFTNTIFQEGAAFVFNGSLTGLSPASAVPANADWDEYGGQNNAQLGYGVACAGDVNGDRFDDIVVGAAFFDNGQTDEGRIQVYHGSTTGPGTTADMTAESNSNPGLMGLTVASAGDINGDGYDDLIVGAPSFSNGAMFEGKAFVFRGNNGGGLQYNARQYRPGTNVVVSPAANSTVNNEIRTSLFASSFLGRQDIRLWFEYVNQDDAFSAPGTVSNVIGQTPTWTDPSGPQEINWDHSYNLNTSWRYHWRGQVIYHRTTALTGQLRGPWRYMPNEHIHGGGFRPIINPSTAGCKTNSTSFGNDPVDLMPSALTLGIAPNPVNQGHNLQLNIENPEEQEMSLNILGVNGQSLYNRTFNCSAGISSHNIPTDQFAAGIYFLQIRTNTQTIHKKFVVQ